MTTTGTATHRVTREGVNLAVDVGGEGPPIVLAHGFPELAFSWRHQVPALLEAGFKVAVPDQRGYGRSDRPDAIEAYDIVQLTGDLLAVLDSLGEERAIFVGHDWGALVVWQLALMAPERVAGVVGMSVPFLPRAPLPTITLLRQIYANAFFYMVYFQEPGVADAELSADPARTMRRMLAGLAADQFSGADRAAMSADDERGFIARLPEPKALPPWLSQEELDHYVAEFHAHRVHRRPQLVPEPGSELASERGLGRRPRHLPLAVHRGHPRPGADLRPTRLGPGLARRPPGQRAHRGGRPLGPAGTAGRGQRRPARFSRRRRRQKGTPMTGSPLRFGVFYAPFHPLGQDPTLALEYDLERVVELDRVGFDEAWFGEHHSGGYELIGCPEIFIAVAAERTKHIRLGTGVVSLPYHHPWLVADRMVLLDHLTRGRVMFGTGPGALPSDAFVMGIDPVDQRRRMEESLEAILALLRSEEPVTRETDWFTMKEARLQLRPYTHPHFEVAVAAMISPSGPRLAGRYQTSLLSLSMQVIEGGFAAIGQAWGVVEEQAAAAGHAPPDRNTWRVLGAMHIAETRDKAIEDCTFGLKDFSNYFGTAGFVPLGYQVDDDGSDPRQFVESYAAGGNIVIGTPDDAIAYIEGLLEQSGGFGGFLLLGHDWADREATLRSYRLFAREVIPHFKGRLGAPRNSHDWASAKRDELFGRAGQAIVEAITSHVEEKAAATTHGSD